MEITKITIEIEGNPITDKKLFNEFSELNRKFFSIGLDINKIPTYVNLENGKTLLIAEASININKREKH